MRSPVFVLLRKLGLPGKVSLFILIVMILASMMYFFSGQEAHKEPSGDSLEAPTRNHILGTDDLGIDLAAQILHGAQVSLLVGLCTAFFSGIGGSFLGMISGYYGKKIDKIITGFSDLFMMIPHFPLTIVVAAYFGPGMRNIILVLTLLSWVRPARTIRARILSLKNENYIRVALSYGARFRHLVTRHFLPELLPLMGMNMLRIVSHAIITEAGLSFLGLGDPLSKSWGAILNRSMNFPGIYFTPYWKWWILSPLVSLVLFVLSLAFLAKETERFINRKNI